MAAPANAARPKPATKISAITAQNNTQKTATMNKPNKIPNTTAVPVASSSEISKKRKSDQIAVATTEPLSKKIPTKQTPAQKDITRKTSTKKRQILPLLTASSTISSHPAHKTGFAAARRGKAREDLPVYTEHSIDGPDGQEAYRLSLVERYKKLDLEEKTYLRAHAAEVKKNEDFAETHGFLEDDWVKAMKDLTAARADLMEILEFRHPVMREVVYNVASCAQLSKYKVSHA